MNGHEALGKAPVLHSRSIQEVEALTGRKVERVIEINSQIEPGQGLVPQVVDLADWAGLAPAEWQTLPLLVNPSSLNFITVALLAELYARCGYFPAMLRLWPVPGSFPSRYGVAEVVDLQGIRDAARRRR